MRECEVCGCWDDAACVDPETGEKCSWSGITETDVCTLCEERFREVQASGASDEEPSLGACCVCEKEDEEIRNIVMLDRRAPVPGTGWGCLVCNLPSDGAVAVVCDACIEKNDHDALRFAVRGYPAYRMRIPIEELGEEEFTHDLEAHALDEHGVSRN